MDLVKQITEQWDHYLSIHDYLNDLRSKKITRSQRWDYLNPNIKRVDDETIPEHIVNNLVFLAYVIRHPIKFKITYRRILEERKDPSSF